MGPGGNSTNTAQNLETAQANQANTAASESASTYKTTAPGLTAAENYYNAIAGGNPATLFKTIAPAVSQIGQNSEAAANTIKATTPRGGAQDLALQQNDITKASQIGSLATSSFTNSFPALASLAGTGLGLSSNELSNAIAGLSTASNTNTGVMNAQAEGKASTLGMLGSLGSAAATGAGIAVCWLARLIFGERDERMREFRFWLLTANKPLHWRLFTALYVRFGERVATFARTRSGVRWILRLLLDRGLVHARDHIRIRTCEV
jgi:hypothetical protein